MKTKERKKIEEKARRIVELEKQAKKGENLDKVEKEMQDIVLGLSLEDLLYLDQYILDSNLLN